MSNVMTHSPAKVIQWLLIDLGLATDPEDEQDWPAFSPNEPDEPDNCITVYDTAEKADGRIMNDGEVARHWGFQVRIRAVDQPTGRTKAEAIRHTFDEGVTYRAVTVGAKQYLVHGIYGTNMLPLGKEVPKTKRRLFTINGTTTIRVLN